VESKFKKLQKSVAKGYAEKGSKKAMEIGAAVAYKQGVKKYGKEVMAKKSIAGKKKKK
jgi:chromosome segregation and condensation protein ScpB